MANYSLVVNSKFTPTDYAAQLVPIFSDYGTRWNTEFDKAQENYLENLELKSLVTNEGDTDLSETYGDYEKLLNDFYDAFSRGYDSSVEAKGLAANRKYKEVITPMQREFIKREKKIAEQDAKRAEDGSYIFDYDYRDAKISDMMKHPNRTYNAIKGNDIKNDAYNFIDAVSKAVYSSNYEGLNDQEKQFIKHWESEGYSPDTLIRYIKNPDSAPAYIKEGIENIKERYVDMGDFNGDQQALMDDYIQEGALLAAGSYKYQWLENPNYGISPERAKQLKEWEYLTAQSKYEEQLHKETKAKYDSLMSEGKYNTGNYLKDGRKSTTGKTGVEEDDKLEFKEIGGLDDKPYYEATSTRYGRPLRAYNEDQRKILEDIHYNSTPDVKKMVEQGEDVVLEAVGCVLDDEWFNNGQEERTKKSHLSEDSNNVDMFSQYTIDNLTPIEDDSVENAIVSRLTERIYDGKDVTTVPVLQYLKDSHQFYDKMTEFVFIRYNMNKVFVKSGGMKNLITYFGKEKANETQIGKIIDMVIEGIVSSKTSTVINTLKKYFPKLDYTFIQECIDNMSTDYDSYIVSTDCEKSRKDYITGYIENMKQDNKLVFGQLGPRKERKRESKVANDYVVYKVKDIEDINFKK